MDERGEQKKRLREAAVFRELPETTLEEIAGVVETKEFPAGALIFRKDDPADSLWIVSAGKVRVFLKDEDGVETTLSHLGPGQSFGEMALLTGEPRSANVETLEETRLTYLAKEEFHRILKDHPDVSLGFVKQMSRWLRHEDQRLQQETRAEAHEQKTSWTDFVLLIGLSVLFAVAFNHSNPNGIALFPKPVSAVGIPSVEPAAVIGEYEKGEALFVDAMPGDFHEQAHIRGAVNIPLPLFEISYLMNLGEEDKGRKIIVYGRTISRPYDKEVAEKLLLRGHKNVSILEGGLSAWRKKGYPVEP
ncbi:MAG: cyclic nucleotide-binding domain-containing protein [Deltaproteobacteria bacterium]|nr:cyclic nucleotide-binding domain-containing protein [Deltaproteobacteria bacterium]